MLFYAICAEWEYLQFQRIMTDNMLGMGNASILDNWVARGYEKKGVTKMKKIMLLTMTMVFALSIGAAYAGMDIYGAKEGDHAVMFNGITNFSGRSIDTTADALKIGAADWGALRDVAEVEGASAGGLRAGEMELQPYNGITNFSGRGYATTSDALKIGPEDWGAVPSKKVVEGASAGGLRAGEMELHPFNGVTDFSGRSYDLI